MKLNKSLLLFAMAWWGSTSLIAQIITPELPLERRVEMTGLQEAQSVTDDERDYHIPLDIKKLSATTAMKYKDLDDSGKTYMDDVFKWDIFDQMLAYRDEYTTEKWNKQINFFETARRNMHEGKPFYLFTSNLDAKSESEDGGGGGSDQPFGPLELYQTAGEYIVKHQAALKAYLNQMAAERASEEETRQRAARARQRTTAGSNSGAHLFGTGKQVDLNLGLGTSGSRAQGEASYTIYLTITWTSGRVDHTTRSAIATSPEAAVQKIEKDLSSTTNVADFTIEKVMKLP